MLTTRRAGGLLAACVLLVAGLAAPAAAAPAECNNTAGGRICEVTAKPPSTPGSAAPAPGSTGSVKVTCQFQGEPIDCDPPRPGLWWSNDRQCWVGLVDPQPAKDDLLWAGNSDGAIYQCFNMNGTSFVPWALFWLPATVAPAGVSPAVLAREAVERMDLVPPTVGATPRPGPEAVSLIGLPTWLWIEGADERSWGPITRTASAGGVTVTATAAVDRVVWDMGDGNTVTCRTKGTEWTRAKGTGDSPTCGYRYTKRGPRTITATTFWQVDWSGAGQSGVITFDLSGSREVNVVELRAVITG